MEVEFWKIGKVARAFPWLPRNRRVSKRREVSEVMRDEVPLGIVTKRSLATSVRTVCVRDENKEQIMKIV